MVVLKKIQIYGFFEKKKLISPVWLVKSLEDKSPPQNFASQTSEMQKKKKFEAHFAGATGEMSFLAHFANDTGEMSQNFFKKLLFYYSSNYYSDMRFQHSWH